MATPKYFKAWIIFFLIATIAGAVAGGVCGGIIGGVMGVAGFEMGMIKIAAAVAGFVVGAPISYLTFCWVVGEFIVKPITEARVPPVIQPPVASESVPPVIPPASGAGL